MKDLLNYLPSLRGKKVGVYGDLIADEYVYGTIHRFSREAPVFVVNYEASQIGPGGAANAINNIHGLGGNPYPFGVLGNDTPGRTLLHVLKEKGISTDGIVCDDDHPTFIKQRVVAGSPHSVKQQILRIDRCLPLSADAHCHKELTNRLSDFAKDLDVLIISDYGLGVASSAHLAPILKELSQAGLPCFVDSRYNLQAYAGVTAATPNEPELESILGKSVDAKNIMEAGKHLLTKLDLQALLITRGRNGMALFTKNQDPRSIPIFGSSDIVDVTGAGDTVITTFALAVAAGASFYDAARLANCAAGLVVMKRGAATVTPEELGEAIRIADMHE
ncbi:bifunctional ADP-heptose synthase [bacterium]|nr:bifunctional ADP-heptose synthase [bacterium]